jgi:hypothetical protein
MNHLRLVGLFTVATLAVALASCSGPGGDASVAPKRTAGPIVFTGSSITDNVMTLPCATDETFNVSQSGYSGTFSLVPSDPVYLSISPTTGTSATPFTAFAGYDNVETWTVTATNADGVTGVLTVDYLGDQVGDCG